MSPPVNRPTDPKQRDRDVENKLRLWGIYQAFSNGKLPSNKQIDIALSSLANQKKLKEPNSKLSDEGKVLIQDFQNVILELKTLILTKNHDQALQEFIWNASQLGQKGGPEAPKPDAPVSKEDLDAHGRQASEGLKKLANLIVTNGQFRKLLNDATILLRDIAGDAATRTASRLGPTEDELSQIDKPAPDSTWHDAPDFSRDKIRNQLREKINLNKPLDRNEVREAAGTATQAADPSGTRDPAELANQTVSEQQKDTQQGIDAQQAIRAGVGDIRQRVDENIPEEHKQRGREYRDRTKEYLSNKMPQERREQTIWRLKKMVVEIQGHRDYDLAIDTLLDLAETYTGHARTLMGTGAGAVKDAHQDSHLATAEQNLKTIIERFANNTSSDDLIDAINDIYRDADRDPELKNWFKSVDRFVRKCLKEQGYILQPDATHEYNQLYDHGNFLLRNRYRDHTDRLTAEVKFMGDQFVADPDNKRFGDALQKLFKDLGNDESGKPAFKKHLIKDITQVILPDVFESVRYVPVPRIEYSDKMIDTVVENLVIESDNLMPNVLEVDSDTHVRWGRKTVSSKRTQQVMVHAAGIQCDLKDVSYYIKRKQGFPALKDTGVADIFLGGDGFSFTLELSTAEKKDRAHFFKVDKVKVQIKKMNIKLKQSKHKALFGLFKPLLLTLIRPAVTKALEQQIKQTFSDLDALAFRINEEQKKIEDEIKRNPDPENVQNIYDRYVEAAKREFTKKKSKAEEAAADKKVNVAVTKQDSIFKNVSLPGGISTRATELKQQAERGDRWENDIFTIGSASPSASLPHPTPITRKSPHAQRRAIRERDAISTGGQSRDSGYVPDAPSSELGGHGHSSGQAPNSGNYTSSRGPEGGFDRYQVQPQNAAGFQTTA